MILTKQQRYKKLQAAWVSVTRADSLIRSAGIDCNTDLIQLANQLFDQLAEINGNLKSSITTKLD